MSTETHVFFRGKLPTKAALSRAMKDLGFPFSIKPVTGSLEEQSGFMPMLLRREETGVEFDVWNDHSAVTEFADVGVDPSFERVANFRWGGDFQEAIAGMCAAAALAKLVSGVVFDEAEDKLLSVDDAIGVARKNLNELPEPPKQRRPRGPTVLKRILAPLLAKRSDLVLANHLLLIRPVRHLIRGAIFNWHHGGTVCSAAPYVRPLYQPGHLSMEDAVFSASFGNPDFAPMLFDRLAVEVFEPLGKLATIEDFIESAWGKRIWPEELFYSILLSRGLEEAKAVATTIDEADNRFLAGCKARLAAANRKDAVLMYHRRSELKSAEEGIERSKERQAFLARGEAAVFEHYRAWEAEVARGHKIEQAWEPTPFPAQLPAAQRATKSADPRFAPTPWLDFPDTWRQDPPETPGEMRFASGWWYRQGRLELLHPMTCEQAEARHRDFGRYVLAARLPEGQVLILSCDGSSGGEHLPLMRHQLWVYDSQGLRMIVDFREDHDDPGLLKMRSIDIKGAKGWYSSLNFEQNEKSIHDHRSGENSYACRPMTDEDRSLYAFRLPGFAEFDGLWQRISTYLSNEGFGVFA
jgi:hypothetical protein